MKCRLFFQRLFSMSRTFPPSCSVSARETSPLAHYARSGHPFPRFNPNPAGRGRTRHLPRPRRDPPFRICPTPRSSLMTTPSRCPRPRRCRAVRRRAAKPAGSVPVRSTPQDDDRTKRRQDNRSCPSFLRQKGHDLWSFGPVVLLSKGRPRLVAGGTMQRIRGGEGPVPDAFAAEAATPPRPWRRGRSSSRRRRRRARPSSSRRLRRRRRPARWPP